jgi:hypothetical protein
MHIQISASLKSLASTILGTTNIKDVPKMLSLLEKFLREEPEEDFESTSFRGVTDVPLTLKEKAVEHFKEKTSEFPYLYETGHAGEPVLNFLYTLGQLLTKTALIFEINDKPDDPHFQKSVRKFYAIWGSYREMNARSLVNKYAGQSTPKVKREVLMKLVASINLIENEIVPKL